MRWPKLSDEECFSEKVSPEPNTGCWLWAGAIAGGTGYGHIVFRGKQIGAHRASWMMHFGEIPAGLFICHRCDNRACVNPDHLFVGSQAQNMKDCASKGRTSRGESNPGAKLTDAECHEIRRLVAGGSVQRRVATKFGVAQSQVSRIVNGRRRGHS